MSWGPTEIKAARAAIEGAATFTDGYRVAATKLSKTPTAVRLAHERGTLGLIEPKLRTVASELAALKSKAVIASVESHNKSLLVELANVQERLALYESVSRPARAIVAPATKGRSPKQRKGTAVFIWSDWHVEEEVDPATVNGLNEFNLRIASKRIRRLVEGCAWLLNDPRYDIRAVVIGLIGDLISGYIHAELVESNLLSPQEGIVWLLDELESALRLLAVLCPNVERFVIACKSGNHGRATDKIRISTREANSNEAVLYQTLARVMRDDPRFEFVITPGIWTEVIATGFPLMFTHGDAFSYGGGVGGISIPIRRGIARKFSGAVGSNGAPIHMFNMGHFHKRTDDGEIQVNGSLIGYGPYSEWVNAKFERPQQHFYIVDAEYGKSISAPVWLDKDNPEQKRAAIVPPAPASLKAVA